MTLIEDKSSPEGLGMAVALGSFSGTIPFPGFQSKIALGFSLLFRVNRLITLTASWVATPLLAPILYYTSIQVGEYLRHGSVLPLSIESFRAMDLSPFFLSWLLGSFVTGILAGLVSFLLTSFLARYFIFPLRSSENISSESIL